MVAKSIREAKSTVSGFPPGSTETGLEPDCGVNVRPVIVTRKEITLHRGASPPKIAKVPGLVIVVWIAGPLGPPHPLSRRMPIAASVAIAKIYFFTVAYLLSGKSARARGSRTVVVPAARTLSMLP
jgi:hypothetical protein